MVQVTEPKMILTAEMFEAEMARAGQAERIRNYIKELVSVIIMCAHEFPVEGSPTPEKDYQLSRKALELCKRLDEYTAETDLTGHSAITDEKHEKLINDCQTLAREISQSYPFKIK